MERDCLQQIVFNAAIGNPDAHPKNTSLLLADDGQVEISPLYDSLPLFLRPQYD